MAQFTQEAVCPKCDSRDLCWRGTENDNRPPNLDDSAEPNPSAMVHKWECQTCGVHFKQYVE